MTVLIAHLGPVGTNTEQAANLYLKWLAKTTEVEAVLCPYPSIAQTLVAVAQGKATLAVVPMENSIEGGVTVTLDTLWQLDTLQINHTFIVPIAHTLVSCAASLEEIKTVYSHPQALAQCQGWLNRFLPCVQLIPRNSTTEALVTLEHDLQAAAISSPRAAQLYKLPILANGINDYPENFTRFCVVSKDVFGKVSGAEPATHTSLAFTTPANVPGALVKPLQVFAHLGINLSRIESRPTKRSLGEYLFFVDAEADSNDAQMQFVLAELKNCTEVLKIFGSYNILPISGDFVSNVSTTNYNF